jgi:fructose-1,6-bisphosphatase/inositol monophosphatase family enzyme
VVLPQLSVYLEWDKSGLFTSQPISIEYPKESAPIYFAYPPDLSDESMELRSKLFHQIDKVSSGLYRSGSACIGLFNLLEGRHKAFVGLNLRAWDFLAYIPILASQGVVVHYYLQGEKGTILASRNPEVIDDLLSVFPDDGASRITRYNVGEALQWSLKK